MAEEEKKPISPTEYFEAVKERKQTMTDQGLAAAMGICIDLYEKYKKTNQQEGMKKLAFEARCIEKERELVKLGIDTFVYRNDVEEYINNVSEKVVKVIEVSRFEREIPDEIIDAIGKTSHIFDKFYVVCTDYTGEIEKKVDKERRDKDPIVFGAFGYYEKNKNRLNNNEKDFIVMDRMYYIGDWVDEFCDLTLNKMVAEMSKKKSKDILRTIRTPQTEQELLEDMRKLLVNADAPPEFKKGIKTVINDKIQQVKTFLTNKTKGR
jgi:hypothetical protein